MPTTEQRPRADYTLYTDGRFEITGYNQKRPFSNFLPGIAGLRGTPMWAFYVNRGQGIASFGTRNKDNAILEFYPANKAYQNTPSLGFRTFFKIIRGSKPVFYEPFREEPGDGRGRSAKHQKMEISSHELTLRETHPSLGLSLAVRYFTIPNEPLAVLARELEISNQTSRTLELEVLDGLPSVIPFGMNEFFIKNMSRTIEAWMLVQNIWPRKAPYFRLKVDATDRPEVVLIEEGNFFFSLLAKKGRTSQLLDPVVDPGKIFGSAMDFSFPKRFREHTPFTAAREGIFKNRTPCAFSHARVSVAPRGTAAIRSFFGHAATVDLVNRYVARAKRPGYFESKRRENRICIEAVKRPLFTASGSQAYDLYCGQTFLDNILRGGTPIPFGGNGHEDVFYVYSRKHGDLERDYNRFLVEPTYFSQGDGNYRDVNQNRRNDVWFDPRVRDRNIRTFLNLVQLDGYNPLVIKGTRFRLNAPAKARRILRKYFGKNAALAEKRLVRPFRLGLFCRWAEEEAKVSGSRFDRLWGDLSPWIRRDEQAEHGEGFWTDHWTYNLDLIESYLAIYPEDWKGLLLSRKEYIFYDNDHYVVPRSERYTLKTDGALRQYESVRKSKEKAQLIAGRTVEPHAVRTRRGRGSIYRTNLFVKLLCLFANKIASLDASGKGIEMEADKPSWYDALNGLPGLVGSSLPETFELKRLILFLIQSIDELRLGAAGFAELPAELHVFIRRLGSLLERYFESPASDRDFNYWKAASAAKEDYRRKVFWGLSGREKKMFFSEVKLILEHARERIEIGLGKAFDEKTRLYPTYFENEALRYRAVNGGIEVKAFRQRRIPFFLEGPVHAMKVEKDPAARRSLYRAVRNSDLYDRKLKMYKVNAPLDSTSMEAGRCCVFAPGWLENESIWLHMEYKWMLEVLKSGLTDEFFGDFRRALIPFQDPSRYGRSHLENSSFIVSSAFHDASLHGGGYVARLSGSTAEFIHMWLLMNIGKRPFAVDADGKVSLRFQPLLPAFLFTREAGERSYVSRGGDTVPVLAKKNTFQFLFLGKTLVSYHNPKRLDTFGRQRASVREITVHLSRGRRLVFKGDTVPSPYALKIRDEFVPKIEIELG